MKKLMAVLVPVVLLLVASPVFAASPTPDLAGTWYANTNSYQYVMNITQNGTAISGTMVLLNHAPGQSYPFSGSLIQLTDGRWKIFFIRTYQAYQEYTGYVFVGNNDAPPAEGIAGTYTSPESTDPYGWYARKNIVFHSE